MEAVRTVSERRFNPTLVRLRPGALLPAAGTALAFQSHAGSIEAWIQGQRARVLKDVSIPRWFD